LTGAAAGVRRVHHGRVDKHEQTYIGLGANIGDAAASLARAVTALEALPGVALTGVSALYRTRPVGPVDQGHFHNAVVGLQAPAGPDPASGAMALLIALKSLERTFGREERERWGPREIDLDLLLFGSHRIHVAREDAARSADPARSGVQWLDIPHDAARDRLFVLTPLADLASQLSPPGWGMTVAVAMDVAEAKEGPDSVQVVARWDGSRSAWQVDPSLAAGS
jgi:2-amino-4-hydroxy-6-hydroxymethyldihydropteridine diphosphokinase